MEEKILADASPEKRLFISLITRDISLIDAFLDIIDNSINSALEPIASRLKTADDYQKVLANPKITPEVEIDITITSGKIFVEDNAFGISSDMAQSHVFKFGRDEGEGDATDRLSVYGIGLKRAIFKCGNKIHITSDHREGGFELDLNVGKWAAQKKEPWTFEITKRPPEKAKCGTKIVITELHKDVVRRISDGLFIEQLKERISRTYAFFIGRIIEVNLNKKPVLKESFDIGKNHASEAVISGGVSCSITAGIAVSSGEKFRDKNAGWFVFCNGRAVLFADKTTLTGWSAGLPIFQPKHRPFLGTVFFVSTNPELLPWTTTKSSINEESAIWQEAKRYMIATARGVIGYLDKRYTDDGTEVTPVELQDTAKGKINVLATVGGQEKSFSPPAKSQPKEIRIQYWAKTVDAEKVRNFLRDPSMSRSEIGRYTFNHFLKNEIGESD